jgi:predicted acylesterase/phospholipase RssA
MNTKETKDAPATLPPWESGRPFHVLALSGGGFRGLYTATVLKHLEAQLGAPLASRFDLICGTSAGGLLALGVAAEIPAAGLQAMFQEHGGRIFNSRGGLRRLLGGLKVAAKHSPDGLRGVLEEMFGELTIGDLKHRVLIPSVNYSKGSGQFFKTPHAPQFSQDHVHKLVDVGMATAAAPTYFPLHQIGEEGVFADGGLVGNSPGLFGLHEAHHVLKVPRGQGCARVRKLNQRAGNVKNGLSGQSERIDKVAVGFNQLHNAVKAIIELIINLLKRLFNSLSNQFSNVVKINTETKQPLSPQQKTDYVNSRPQSLGWYNELKDEVKTLPKERKNDNVPRFRMR